MPRKRKHTIAIFTECPDAPVIKVYWDRKVRTLLVLCPYCGERHIHGAGPFPATDSLYSWLGHRGAHCVVNGKDRDLIALGYNLVETVDTLDLTR